jgi:hypothetical protein
MLKRPRKPTANSIRNAIIDECARAVPTNWCDPLLTGPQASKTPLDGDGVEKLLRGIQDRIRALKTAD